MKRSTLAASATAGMFVAALAVAAAPVQAKPHVVPVICATWQMRGATGAYPAVSFGGPPAGSEVSNSSAKLVKPVAGVQPGVEFAAKNLVLTTSVVTTVKVAYVLSTTASPSSGAIRLFGYEEQNADTLLDAPDWVAIASSEVGGNLVLTVPAGKAIGTLGLVYDASNSSAGSVTFTGMRVGAKSVRFTPCPPVPSKSPSASASVSASASASASAPVSPSQTPPPTSASTSVSPSASASQAVTCQMFLNQDAAQAAYRADPIGHAELDADQDGKACDWGTTPGTPTNTGNDLPLTGPSIGLFAGAGLIVIGTGMALVFLARRRKVGYPA